MFNSISNRFKITLFFLISFLAFGCNQDKRVDVSHVKVNLSIQRFDQEFAKIKPNELAVKLPELKKKYGVFYDDYFEKILSVGSTKDQQYYTMVEQILTGKPFQDLQKETDSVYPNLEKQRPQLEDAFKHIKYEYPDWKEPKIIAYISGFQVQTPIGSDYIGIGLDMFLGSKSKFYPALVESVPRYISRRFTPENITPRVVEVIAREDLFPTIDQDKSLLAKMIYNGKVLYFMSKVLPDVSDSTLIGYSEKQMKWANDFESDAWAYFLEQDLLFDTDYFKTQKYLAEAPFTPGLGNQNDSAPKLGLYIGWQIVKKFVENNPEMTLKDLMLERDEQKILNQAKYRPSNKPKE
ncbi:gliding motility lipoprotein GldB [Pedobacter cryophilus]|uniref:gliding motility lipoprotein GldB n=1 Tax=Pedobacter cryophilus TaxID=2571271 RepID=UPI001CEDDC7B|nr:gliding motility lipoprotein GldB [Pedobacter cryophilus]